MYVESTRHTDSVNDNTVADTLNVTKPTNCTVMGCHESGTAGLIHLTKQSCTLCKYSS